MVWFESGGITLDGQQMSMMEPTLGDLSRKEGTSRGIRRAFHFMKAQGCSSWPPFLPRDINGGDPKLESMVQGRNDCTLMQR